MASFCKKDEADFISRLILVTGGARSGKSRFALDLAEGRDFQQRLFVATGVACDREMLRRIARHRQERNGRWATLEEPYHLPGRIPAHRLTPGSVLVVDCLPTFLTNLLLAQFSLSTIRSQVKALLRTCRRPGLTAIFVTNEVGLGLVPETRLGRSFRDLLGLVNQRVAEAADEVYLLIAGIPMRLK